MAKYQRYAEYKDSGVEWLGEIPQKWSVWKLNHFAPIVTCGVAATPEYQDEGIPFLSAQNVKKKKIDLSKGYKFISTEKHEELTRNRKPEKGDILLSRVGTIGEGCIVDVDFEFSIFVSLTHLRLIQKVCVNEFFIYLTESSYIKALHGAVTLVGGGVGNLNVNDLREYKLPIPSVSEQSQIVNFLDHETAKIDSLIEKQQKLIELLKEKRQAVISHAVTKGLNPDVPMKDSGVEWLGQVPEHWVVSKLKNIIQSLESGCSVNAADVPAQAHELGVLKTSCVYTRSFRIEENKTVVPEDVHRVKCKVRKGAIIISRMNTPELVGASALVKVEVDNIYLPDRLWQTIFFKNVEIDAEYLSHFFTVQGFRDQIALGAEGASSSMQNIAKEDYLNINCLVPPIVEQVQIRDFIAEKLMKLDSLNIKAQEAIERLNERRTALISAAVTGKIDVRNWQAPNATEREREFST